MRRSSRVASGLLAVTLAEAVTALVVVLRVGHAYFDRPDSELTVSNVVIGVSLAGAGWLLARHRPGNLIGWLLLVGGVGYALSGAGFAVLVAAGPAHPSLGWRVLAVLTDGGWPWTIGVLLPLVLLLFPDGRLLRRWWRWVAATVVVDGVLFVGLAVLPSQTLSDSAGTPGGAGWVWLDHRLPVLGPVTTVVGLAGYLAATASLVLRYRRGDERTRRQLLWVLYGTGLMVVLWLVSEVLGVDSLLVGILPATLVPISIAVAVLRHRLLDIRLVISRSVLYLLLTGGIVAGYAAVVLALGGALRPRATVGASVVVTLLVAVAFDPARAWLQRRLDRRLYGARADPVRAVAEVGARLGAVGEPGQGLVEVLGALCRVMRLPAASIVVDGTVLASFGDAGRATRSLPLPLGPDRAGELVVGLRTGESRLAPADERVLDLVSASLAVAVRSARLAEELVAARHDLVMAREEERARLQRDLHDGLGPPLTAVVLEAEAARRSVRTDPDRAAALMADVRAQAGAMADDVRRLVRELRPPALDRSGLVEAVRQHAATLTCRADGSPLTVTVEATGPADRLPAAVEVAAYRITTEALTNVARHSTAHGATVTIQAAGSTLRLVIRDDGGPGQEWTPGIGLRSLRQRARELGGSCRAGPDASGGLVAVSIPVGTG